MNRLIDEGAIQPRDERGLPARATSGDAALKVHHNEAEGKVGVLCMAPEAGLGINDPEFRERIGEDKITLFQRHAAASSDRPHHRPSDTSRGTRG